MTLWIGIGFDAPMKFIADNEGEFVNSEYRDVYQNLNIEACNTGSYSPWQNGSCEHNHALVDDCVAKILEENP